jgi:hypothetical protein
VAHVATSILPGLISQALFLSDVCLAFSGCQLVCELAPWMGNILRCYLCVCSDRARTSTRPPLERVVLTAPCLCNSFRDFCPYTAGRSCRSSDPAGSDSQFFCLLLAECLSGWGLEPPLARQPWLPF